MTMIRDGDHSLKVSRSLHHCGSRGRSQPTRVQSITGLMRRRLEQPLAKPHAFGLRKKTRVPGGNPCMHDENKERRPWSTQELNPGPVALRGDSTDYYTITSFYCLY